MADDTKKALDFLEDTAKNAAKGLTEESEVYRIAENIVDNNKALFGTVNAIVNKELGGSISLGENKELGFMIKPEERKAQLGFKMSFQAGDVVTGNTTIVQALQEYVDDLARRGKGTGAAQGFLNKMQSSTLGSMLIDDVVKDSDSAVKFFRNPEILGMTQDMRTSLRSVLGSAAETIKPGSGVVLTGLQKKEPASLVKGLTKEQLTPEGKFFVTARPKVSFGLKAATPHIYRAIPKIVDNEARLFATVMAFTGLRPEELYRITADQIDLESFEITNVGGKKGGPGMISTGGKTFTLSPLALEAAAELKENADENGKIFKKSQGSLKSKIKDTVISELDNVDPKLNNSISKGKLKGFQVKLFRDIVQTGGKNIGLGVLGVKEMAGHTLKGSDIQMFYTSGERILPGVNEEMRLNATRLQNAFLKNAGFESPREFGLQIGLSEDKVGRLETALIEPEAPSTARTTALPADQEIIDESKTRTSTQASKEVRETAAEKIAREQARTTGLQGRVQELESAAAKSGTRAGTGKTVAREGGKQVLKKLGLLGVGTAVGIGAMKTIIGGPIGAATTVAQLGIDQYVNPREFKKSEEYQPYQLAKKIQSQEKGLRSFISSDEAVKANYEKLHGMGYSKRDALSQGKEKQLQSRENLKSQLASIFT